MWLIDFTPAVYCLGQGRGLSLRFKFISPNLTYRKRRKYPTETEDREDDEGGLRTQVFVGATIEPPDSPSG